MYNHIENMDTFSKERVASAELPKFVLEGDLYAAGFKLFDVVWEQIRSGNVKNINPRFFSSFEKNPRSYIITKEAVIIYDDQKRPWWMHIDEIRASALDLLERRHTLLPQMRIDGVEPTDMIQDTITEEPKNKVGGEKNGEAEIIKPIKLKKRRWGYKGKWS